VLGVHVTQLFSFPSGDPAEFEGLSAEDLGYLQFLQAFVDHAVHDKLQAAQPQTVAHALADSRPGSSPGAASCSATASATTTSSPTSRSTG
jgi:epoxide hydrolase